ncbi:MAG TPA: IS3 family transposase, partial [Candidatus Onthomonas avicola]|nr:IS3 family transposase [Candidatus Onthomonas avicola]
TKEEVQSILFRYISYYNLRRISLVNGGLPPLVYRQQYLERTGAA